MGLTVGSREASLTDARVVVDAVNAGALVEARGGCAVLIVGLAVVAGKSTATFTSVKVKSTNFKFAAPC